MLVVLYAVIREKAQGNLKGVPMYHVWDVFFLSHVFLGRSVVFDLCKKNL